MDELIRKLIERLEITEEQARVAAGTVVEYLQEHLPDSVAGELAALFERPDEPVDPERAKKVTAAVAATTAAVNVVVLPGAH